MRKICFITGTRAEYGLLSRLMKMVQDDNSTQLQIIATNMHLSPKFGNTYQEIENDGFTIDKKIPILEDGKDDANATLKSMAKALSGFADAYDELKPDMVVVLGDRYEILAAATAALIERIPIAHIHGGGSDFRRHQDTLTLEARFVEGQQVIERELLIGVGTRDVRTLLAFTRQALGQVQVGLRFITRHLDGGDALEIRHFGCGLFVHLDGRAVEPAALVQDLSSGLAHLIEVHRTDGVVHVVGRDIPLGTLFYCPRRELRGCFLGFIREGHEINGKDD